MQPPLAVSEEVRDAVATGRPVVALETAIVTHGLSRPTNVEVALDAEHALRAAGVVPATIGVVDGRAVVGLSEAELRRLGDDDDVVKLSGRDLPVALARGAHGGTTVAATALLAHRAGIAVFATGGLGGVHRGASATFDESADLATLADVPILVVSSGVKSILDIGATLERLETLSVTVLGYRTDTFPGFYVRDSGFGVPERVDSADEVAAVLRARDALGLRSAVLLANPVTAADQLDPEVHARVLDEALADAASAGVRGNATTPHLLDHMRRATEGASLAVNLAAYRGNVALAGEVAASCTRALPWAGAEGTARVRDAYDAVAADYESAFRDELDHKPLDRALLTALLELAGEGTVADLGCGPGHVTRWLAARHAETVGVDLSPAMIALARRRAPGLAFTAASMTDLPAADAAWAGVVALFSIIHMTAPERAAAARELGRVLRPGGAALVAFHVDTPEIAAGGSTHLTTWFDRAVDIDGHFHDPAAVTADLAAAGLDVVATTVREPIEGVEFPSRRAYLLARRGASRL